MKLKEARKECDALQKQIKSIEEKYIGGEGFAKYEKEKEIKPFYLKWSKLMTAINKAERITEI